MKQIISTTAVIAALSAGTAASAQGMAGDWYVSVFGGYSSIGSVDTDYVGDDVEHEFDDSYVLGLAVGRSVAPNLRAEVELSYSSYEGGDVLYNGSVSDETDGEVATTYLMGNLWYDLAAMGGGSTMPYVGGGLGLVSLDADTTFGGSNFGYGDTVSGLALQIGFGVQVPVGAGMVDVGYRLKAASGLDIDDNDGSGVYEDGTFTASNLQVGYTFSF